LSWGTPGRSDAVKEKGDRVCSTGSGGHETDFYASVDIADPTCGADFNHDGGIDGADVNAFFEVCENGGCLP